MIDFSLFYEKLYYLLLGWQPVLTPERTWESIFSLVLPPNTIDGDSQSENQTGNRDENQLLLWEPPNTRPDYWSGPLFHQIKN
jgi:hypothetical protein